MVGSSSRVKNGRLCGVHLLACPCLQYGIVVVDGSALACLPAGTRSSVTASRLCIRAAAQPEHCTPANWPPCAVHDVYSNAQCAQCAKCPARALHPLPTGHLVHSNSAHPLFGAYWVHRHSLVHFKLKGYSSEETLGTVLDKGYNSFSVCYHMAELVGLSVKAAHPQKLSISA